MRLGPAEQPGVTVPATPADYTTLVTYNDALRASCQADTGPLYDHLDSRSNAHDLDALRAALGEDKLTFYSMSYGTLIGEQYAELFPGRIRAMALDSNEDHSVDALAWVTRLSQALEQSYGQFADWCARTASCVLHPRDARSVLDQLYARAQQGTISVPGYPDNAITPRNSDRLHPWRADRHRQVARPDAEFARRVERTHSDQRPPGDHRQRPSFGRNNAVDQHGGSLQRGRQDRRRLRRPPVERVELRRPAHAARRHGAGRPHTHLSTSGFKDVTGCLGCRRPVSNPQRPLAVHVAAPIVMVNSRYDVATPYRGAQRAARSAQIGPSAVLLTYDGTSHVDYDETDFVRSAVDRYLTTLHTPSAGAQCPAVFPS